MKLYGIFLYVAGLVTLATCCDNGFQIIRCRDDLLTDFGASDQNVAFGVFPRVATRDILTTRCRAADDYETCITAPRRNCDELTSASLDGFVDVFDYVCGDGFEAELEYRDCINDQISRIAACGVNLFAAGFGDGCDTIKSDLACVEGVLKPKCSEAAVEHHLKIMRTYLTPVTNVMGCDLDESNTNVPLIVGLSVCAILVVGIFGIIAIVYCRQRREHEHNGQHEMNNIHQQQRPGQTRGYPTSTPTHPSVLKY